jgi:hypothetical protein
LEKISTAHDQSVKRVCDAVKVVRMQYHLRIDIDYLKKSMFFQRPGPRCKIGSEFDFACDEKTAVRPVGLAVTLEAVRITSNLVPLAGVAAEIHSIHRGQWRSRGGLRRAVLCTQQETCKKYECPKHVHG